MLFQENFYVLSCNGGRIFNGYAAFHERGHDLDTMVTRGFHDDSLASISG